jgi:hypothetical protein
MDCKLGTELPKRKVTLEGQEKIRLSGYKQWLDRSFQVHGNSFSYGANKSQPNPSKNQPKNKKFQLILKQLIFIMTTDELVGHFESFTLVPIINYL